MLRASLRRRQGIPPPRQDAGGRDGAAGRGRGGAASDGAAAAGKPPLAPALVPAPPARGSPRSRATESGDAGLDQRSPFLFVNRRRVSLLRVFLPPTIWLTRAAHPGGGRGPSRQSEDPGPGRRSFLRCCSSAPAVRAAGLPGRGAGAGLSFCLFTLNVCVNTHIVLYGQRRGNPSLHDGRFPVLAFQTRGRCEPGRGSRDLGALNDVCISSSLQETFECLPAVAVLRCRSPAPPGLSPPFAPSRLPPAPLLRCSRKLHTVLPDQSYSW